MHWQPIANNYDSRAIAFPFPIRTRFWSELSEREISFFCGDEYLPLPKSHALQINLLEIEDSQRVSKLLLKTFDSRWLIQSQFPYKTVMRLGDKWNSKAGIQLVRQWLHKRQIPYSQQVYLIYDCRVLQMPWKLVIKYWDAWAWSIGVEMLVMENTRQWVCCFHHEDAIIFSSFKPNLMEQSNNNA